jgi:lipoprotein-releasing system ATP-binding protein
MSDDKDSAGRECNSRFVDGQERQIDAVLTCENLGKFYREAGTLLQVLSDINLTVCRGEKIAVVGVSGSGKSTLLNMLGGLDTPSEGRICVRGRNINEMSERAISRWRNLHLGFVYQFHHLLGEFTALENVAMPLLIRGDSKHQAMGQSREILADVGLAERLNHKPSALSGGERQRVAIARALVGRPSCVLMDEPTGNLDPQTAGNVLALLLRLNTELGISIIIVTHDRNIADKMDRTMSLENGRLIEL